MSMDDKTALYHICHQKIAFFLHQHIHIHPWMYTFYFLCLFSIDELNAFYYRIRKIQTKEYHMQIMSHGLYLQICDYSLYYCWHKVKLETDISLFLINGNNHRTKNNLTLDANWSTNRIQIKTFIWLQSLLKTTEKFVLWPAIRRNSKYSCLNAMIIIQKEGSEIDIYYF